jgi:hypothetical protein
MSDQDVIQKAYEADLTQIYGAFASAFTAAQGDKPTEAEIEVQFQRSVAHARHIRTAPSTSSRRSPPPSGARLRRAPDRIRMELIHNVAKAAGGASRPRRRARSRSGPRRQRTRPHRRAMRKPF